MAQRRTRAVCWPKSVMLRLLLQTEKGKTVPARSGHRRSNGTQRFVLLAVVFKAVLENRHRNRVALIAPFENSPSFRETRVAQRPARFLLPVGVYQRAPE